MNQEFSTYQIRVIGLVQGVGFRPFIVRLATQFQCLGTVDNRNDGVIIQLNTTENGIYQFISAIQTKAPTASSIEKIEFKKISPLIFQDFTIVKSYNNPITDEITEISPDIAVCDDCLEDIKSQSNRLNYPLTNCTHCGPRFSIIKALPYDRTNTTMSVFPMCVECKREYEDIKDRRFHAQPIACSHCGPVYLIESESIISREITQILQKAAAWLEEGETIAIKGMGGYHLICDANSEGAVANLRSIKHRDGKPMAVMFRNLETISQYATLSNNEILALRSWRKSIILLNMYKDLPFSINRGLHRLGAILPYMPFHYLLFENCKLDSLVFTSANLAGEPTIIDETSILTAFQSKIKAIVSYNRSIYNRVDDSVGVMINDKFSLIRRSRGFVPSPIRLPISVDGFLALGAELVNTFCLGRTHQAILSQHIGDLKNAETFEFFEQSIENFKRLYKFIPQYLVSDLHPDYLSSQYAASSHLPIIKVQHHHAHMAACMMENGLNESVMAVIMDGTGLGTDGTIWGGEFLFGDLVDFKRFTHFRNIALPGGDQVAYQPWRTAVSYLYDTFGRDFLHLKIPFNKKIESVKAIFLMDMIDKEINSPLSSSAGRLFDAVSAILNLCHQAQFHAEAPMRLEDAILGFKTEKYYPYNIDAQGVDFRLCLRALVEDIIHKQPITSIAAKFHNTVIEAATEVCHAMFLQTKIRKVVLSGGSFQNVYLSEGLIKRLESLGFEVFVHQKVPANDGGIALGQLGIAASRMYLKKI
jgi:hydrogenase maturation protein HypF